MKATSRISLLLLFGLSVVSRSGAQTPPQSEKVANVAKFLLGSWKDNEDKESVVHFEATKCTFARLGKPDSQSIRRLTYDEPGKIVTYDWGRKIVYRFELKDQVLFLTELPDGRTRTYTKLEKVPAEVEVKPLALGEAKELPKEKVQSVQEELSRRVKLDQEVRVDPAKKKEMKEVDRDNTKSLVKLVQEVGWIDAMRFGAQASHDAFLIVQHSGYAPLMLAALPAIETDVKSKRLDAQPYALLYDRLQFMLGKKQRFGTQLGPNDKGELIVLPLEDRKRVEELRREIGLFPLADYLKLFDKQNGGKPVKFADDE